MQQGPLEAFNIWDAAGFTDGAIFDFAIDGDRGLVPSNQFDDNDTILALLDINGDGDFLDAGETQTFLLFSEQGDYPQRPRSVAFYNSVTPVPLPASILFLTAALGGLGLLKRRRNA